MTDINRAPRMMMLGYGWFPDRLGGLNRYFRDLLEHLPEAVGVVVGEEAPTPACVAGVSSHDQALHRRLLAVWRAAQRGAPDVDVVDAHFALYALAPLWLGRLRHKPVVVHFHGPWADESVAGGDRSAVRLLARRALERAAYRRADEAIVLTSAFRQVLVERYRISPWIVNVVPPGVDLQRFSPGSRGESRRELDLADDAFVAVSVRRLVPRMGLELLIEAWAGIVGELPQGSSLLLAGEGPLRGELERAIAMCGVERSVRLLGRISDEELVSLYRAADIAVAPSLEHEGFGLVVLEAAACGTPTIVTRVGGLPEATAGLDASLIVPAGDRTALSERLLRSATERPSRVATRAHAERYDWDTIAERHRAIARRVRARSGTSPVTGDTQSRMKVVYLDHVARLSGGELALLRLLPHLDRVDPHVILAEDGPLAGHLHMAGISTEVLAFPEPARDLRKGDVHGTGVSARVLGASSAYVVKLAARLRSLRPDVVHTNSLKAGVYGSLAARLAGVPMIWHVRDRIDEDYLPHSAVVLVRRMTRHLAAAVVANSRSTMETLAAPRQGVVIYSVLPEVMTEVPARNRVGNGPLTFGVVGRLAPWKGQDLFLQAFAQAFPAGDERAVLIGAALFGEDDYASGLPALARRLQIGDRVEMRGHRSDVWDELARLDVLVHSSVTPEPFGQVILEGMAAGVPVIAAGAGGPAEILRHDETGVLYRPADVAELAGAMQRMCNPELRFRLSAAARTTLGRYSPDVVAAELEDLYAAVIANDRRGR